MPARAWTADWQQNKSYEGKIKAMNKIVQFVLDRATATTTAATTLQSDWLWSEKTVAQMVADAKALKVQAGISDDNDVALTNAVSNKNAALAGYHQTTVTLLGMTRTHYRKNPAATATLKGLHAVGDSEQGILDEGAKLAKVWEELDDTYVPDQGWTLTAFQAAGTAAAAALGAVTTAQVAWSNESAKTDALGAAVEDTNVAWYADATKKFGPETPQGVMIRQTVPTTTAAVQPPAAPVIIKAQALGGGRVHVDFQPPASGWIQVSHQGPGEPAFTVLVEKLKEDFFEQDGFAPGAHSFMFRGVNTGGPGDAAGPIVLQVT
jgi:hypothetical protein